MAVEKTMRVSLLIKCDDDTEAKMVMKDLLEMMEERLKYWGYGLETHTPYTLMGELT